tara:strand:+ start:6608 stop:7093 length:486 start_codon:yes stop_codon:yes gene_type:complete
VNKPKEYKFIFDWILTNKLAIGTSPLKEENINLLIGNKIKNIIGLCSDKEIGWYEKIDSSFKTKRIVLPDSHTKNLPKFDQLQKAFNTLEEFVDNDATFIHCVASVERSPMLCILYVMKTYNISIEDALDYVRRVHKQTNPTNSQLKVLNEFAKHSIIHSK